MLGHPAHPAVTDFPVSLWATSVLWDLVGLLARPGPVAPAGSSLAWPLALSSVGLIFLLAGGWFGGHLMFRYGIGQDRPAGEQ